MQHRFPAEKCGERCCTWRPSPAHMSLQAAHTCCRMTIALLPHCSPLALQQYSVNCLFCSLLHCNYGRALTVQQAGKKKKRHNGALTPVSAAVPAAFGLFVFSLTNTTPRGSKPIQTSGRRNASLRHSSCAQLQHLNSVCKKGTQTGETQVHRCQEEIRQTDY